MAEKLVLRRRLVRMLEQRNRLIKQAAESDAWHQYLDGQPELDRRIYQARSTVPGQQDTVFAK